MKRGEVVFLKRPKRILRCVCVEEYSHYPAVRIKLRENEIIVGREEVMLSDQVRESKREKLREEARQEYRNLLKAWTKTMTWRKWLDNSGACWVWNSLHKLHRLGLIDNPPSKDLGHEKQ